MNVLSQFSLKGKVAIITGGYSHLGQEMTKALYEAGATVIVFGKSDAKFQKCFSKSNEKICFMKVDIASLASIKKGFKSVQKLHGGIDILINNAIYLKQNFLEKMSDSEWEMGIDGVLNSVFRCIKECIPYLKQSKEASIINISSMYGLVSPDFNLYANTSTPPNPANYGAAKAAVIQLTRYCSVYLAKYPIRVNCISPGPFPSKEVQNDKMFIKNICKKTPLGRIGKPDELKGAIVFLASRASSFMTGQNIVIDGGWTAI